MYTKKIAAQRSSTDITAVISLVCAVICFSRVFFLRGIVILVRQNLLIHADFNFFYLDASTQY